MDESLLDTSASQHRQSFVDVANLKLWQAISPRDTKHDLTSEHGKNFEKPPFPIDEKINRKVALWAGDITLLNCQAIVNTTSENFADNSPACARILTRGGPHLRQCLKDELRGCRSGDARITKGYNLFARYIIHTVGPWYKPKFHTAGENILYSCYSKVLLLAREHQIRTLALPPINTVRRKYPPQDGAHIALRVVRRFLEKFSDSLDLIVFVVDDVDIGIYESLMPLYFPRSASEEEQSLYLLPKDIGGEHGEPHLPERQIRISEKPHSIYKGRTDFEESVDLRSGLEASVVVGKSSFAEMHGDIDKKWGRSNSTRRLNDAVSNEIRRRNRYERLLRRSRTEDLSEIAQLRCLYVGGEDRYGRPVIVFIGKRFKVSHVNLEKALLYLIFTLDRIVQRDYVVIYFHTLTTGDNHPPLTYLRYVYETLDHLYKKNLKALYIIHPTFWSRLATWWFTTFTLSAIKNKILCLGGVEYLRNVVSLTQLQIPAFIMDYDFKVNGFKYAADEALPAGL